MPDCSAAASVADHHGAGAVGGRARLVVPDRVPQHRRGLHRLERDVRVAAGGRTGSSGALRRSLAATIAPMCVGRAGPADVGADVRREVAAGPGAHRHGERRRSTAPTSRWTRTASRTRPPAPARARRPGPGRRPRSRSSRRPSRPCAPAAAACRPRRARRPGTARASSRPRTGPAPCRPRPRRCRRRSARRRRAPGRPPRGTARPSTRRSRLARWWVCPTPSTAARTCGSSACLHHADEVLLQGRAAGGVRRRPAGRRRPRSAWRPRRCGRARRRTSGWR